MKDPRDLPELPFDFRRFAAGLAASEDLEDDLQAALDVEVRSRAIVFGGERLPGLLKPAAEIAGVLEKGVRAAEKAAADPEVALASDEDAALEAVVRLQERPALLIRKDSFGEPPPRWKDLGGLFRADVCGRIPCTGRIDSKPGEMCGTGFVVAEDLVMTNRHVIRFFADPPPVDGGKWAIRSSAKPTIDFKVEYSEPEKRVFAILEVVGVHPVQDVALLRVARQASDPAGAQLPAPVKLAGAEPEIDERLDLYAVGYPWLDNENVTPAAVIAAIYEDIFQVKRLQPGEFNSRFPEYGVFSHDCSTLGGNSGSCLVDVRANQVIGLHFKGKYRQANYAVALWELKDDALFKDRGLHFPAANL